jgi:murein DD-endopeptidase MepM/ murein hydrolase activator NlpD
LHTGFDTIELLVCDAIQLVRPETNHGRPGRTAFGSEELSRASLIAAFTAWCICGPTSTGIAADDMRPQEARAAEQRLLGSDNETARFAACQPFTREIAVEGTVKGPFDSSLAKAGVPAVAMLEVRQSLSTVIDLGREVADGDRFYLRYEQAFTAESSPIGVARVLWAEIVTKAKGPFAIHRYRPLVGAERFWLANGEAATTPSMRLPLDAVTVSSGFGLRTDPFDQPPLPATLGKRTPMGGPDQPSGGVSGKGAVLNNATRLGIALGLAPQPSQKTASSRGFHALFMHEGIDLAAPTGTPIYAAADGVVVGAAPNAGYGNWIRIDHPRNLSTIYGHLSEFAPGIKEGIQVSRDELIGFVGSTGHSTGPHLHFEILTNGKAVDPLTSSEIKHDQLRGADLERFRNQVKRARAVREREMNTALVFERRLDRIAVAF